MQEFSKEKVKYINLQFALCPKCKELGIIKRCSWDHLIIEESEKFRKFNGKNVFYCFCWILVKVANLFWWVDIKCYTYI